MPGYGTGAGYRINEMPLFGGVTLPGKPDLDNVRLLDRLPIPTIMRMERTGIAIDIDYVKDIESMFDGEMRELEKDISYYIPREELFRFSSTELDEDDSIEINADSSEQISDLLFNVLRIGKDKKLKSTKAGKRISVDKKQLEGLKYEHPVIPKILAYRQRSKLKSTYCKGLIKAARYHPRGRNCPECGMYHNTSHYRVHTELPTTSTDTGRLASRRPNLQNIPIRSYLGALVRRAFIATPGRKLISTDFSQIELRDLAHCANCESMIEVYLNDGDIHEQTCIDCFGVTKDKIDKVSHRIPSKTANFLTSYGGSGKALVVQLMLAFSNLIDEGKLSAIPSWLSEDWCNVFIEKWFNVRPEVKEYMDLQTYRARHYRLVWSLTGRVRLVNEVCSCHSWIRAAGCRQAGNHPIQELAAAQMKLVMGETNELFPEGGSCWPLLSIHDQLIFEEDEDKAEDSNELIGAVFDSVMIDKDTGEDLSRVPIKSDGEVMDRWEKE